jgi:N-acetylglucosaminyl-diphospho-decaprenol L-rhamnosyltransferase
MSQAPDLSVIVVTHGGMEMALTTLRSARSARGAIDVEWLVVDSGSTDGTPDAIEREFPDMDVVRCPNVGFAAGNNHALRRARGRYVLLLNPDVELLEGTLADVVGALDARPGVGAASVIQRDAGGALQPTIRRFPSAARQLGEALGAARVPALGRLQELEKDASRYRQETSADWLVGAFLVIRSTTLEQVGPLDERFFLYSEETDWCYRIREAGWDIRHLPMVEIVHHGGGYSRPELTAQLSYSKLLFARKHLGPVRRAGLRASLVLGHALRIAGCALLGIRAREPRSRLRREASALAVGLGLTRPPGRAG